MKESVAPSRWRGRIAPPLVLVFSAALAAAPGGSEPWQIVSVRGSVEIGSGDPPTWRAAQEGDLLHPGDAIRTGDDGRVEIRLPAGTTRVYENSVLRLASDRGDRVELDTGRSIFDILRRRPAREFDVRTPEAVVMVKGTRFTVEVDAGMTAVSVYRGLVGVLGLAASRELLVRPGFAAVGGGSSPFGLALIDTASDPWDDWSARRRPPRVPDRLLPTSQDSSRTLRSRLAALEAARLQVTASELEALETVERSEIQRALSELRRTGPGGNGEESDGGVPGAGTAPLPRGLPGRGPGGPKGPPLSQSLLQTDLLDGALLESMECDSTYLLDGSP